MTKPSRAISRCNSAETFGGSAEPSGVCSVARRSAAPRFRGGRPAQGWFEIANAQPGQRGLHSVDDARAFSDQALALPVRPLGVLFGHRRDARHAAVAPFPTQPPQKRPLQQFGVEPVGLRPSMFPRYCDTRGMDHMCLHPTRTQPARQPEAVAAGFEGKRNTRDLATGPDRLIAPAMQQAKQPFGIRLQLLARLTLNAGKHTGNQPARLAHLDDGNDRAILVQGDEGSAQVVRLGHQGTPSVRLQRRWFHFLPACPIPSRWSQEMDSNPRSPERPREESAARRRALGGGRVVQRPLLYLGEINDSQELAWRKSIAVLEEGGAGARPPAPVPGEP